MTRASERRKRLLARVKLAQIPTLLHVAPTTTRDILAAETSASMRGGNTELPHASLFGDAHLQKDLF